MSNTQVSALAWLLAASISLGFALHSVAAGVFLFSIINVIAFMIVHLKG